MQPGAAHVEVGEPTSGAIPVRLWRIGLTEQLGTSAQLDMTAQLSLLDEPELARARRFRFRPHFESFVQSHAALRLILAEELGAPADRIRFSRRCPRCGEGHGKPEIEWPAAAALSFSLSHTTGIALLAIGTHRIVGVDVQHTTDDLNFEGITSVWFEEQESRHIATLDGPAQAARFFQLWTRREACAKALGLSVDHELDPPLASHVADPGDQGTGPAMTVRDLDLGAGYAGALCAAGTGWRTIWHDFPGDLDRSTARRGQSSAT
jgi:4'-phosphopantetheinyl transferase